jgi:hypothetical protein
MSAKVKFFADNKIHRNPRSACFLHSKLTDHGGTARNSSLGTDVEVVDGHSAHEGQLHVRVSVNAA